MRLKRLSENIIYCDNFLPQHKYDEIYMDILENRKKFQTEVWNDTHNENPYQQFLNQNCGGFGFWYDREEIKQMKMTPILSLKDWFFHQGIFSFAMQENMKMFDLMTRSISYSIHNICYNNGGYYNWHKDTTDGTIFTFNLVLNKGDSLSGGDMLFMDNGQIIEFDNRDNCMVVFPSWVDHSITPIKSKDNKDVPFLEQRFSIQYWVRLNARS